MRIDDSGFRKRMVIKSLMTRQLILRTRGSKKMINAMRTPACTFNQLWDNVPEYQMTYILIKLVLNCHTNWRYTLYVQDFFFYSTTFGFVHPWWVRINQCQSDYGPNAIKRWNRSNKACFSPLQKMSMGQVCYEYIKLTTGQY